MNNTLRKIRDVYRRCLQRLVRLDSLSPGRDPRFAIYAARMAHEEELIRKTKELLDAIGDEAMEKHKKLSCEAVPMDDPRRELKVPPEVLKKAHEIGYERLYGLRLHA